MEMTVAIVPFLLACNFAALTEVYDKQVFRAKQIAVITHR